MNINDNGDSCRSRVRWNSCTWRYMDLPAIFRVWGFLKNPLGALLRRRRGHFCCFEVLKNYGVQVGAAPEQVPKKIKIKKMYYQKKLKPIFTRHTPSIPRTSTACAKFKKGIRNSKRKQGHKQDFFTRPACKIVLVYTIYRTPPTSRSHFFKHTIC